MRPVASGVTDRRQERRNGRKDERRYDYHGDGFRRIRGFYVLEETRINARSYLLVTDAPEGEDGECYILKDMSGQQDAEAVYEFVEDDSELDALMKVFEELLSDADVDLEK